MNNKRSKNKRKLIVQLYNFRKPLKRVYYKFTTSNNLNRRNTFKYNKNFSFIFFKRRDKYRIPIKSKFFFKRRKYQFHQQFLVRWQLITMKQIFSTNKINKVKYKKPRIVFNYFKKKINYSNYVYKKQLCRYYDINSKKQYSKWFDNVKYKSELTLSDERICLLESRLVSIIYRMNFSLSLFHSRQLISHGHILVNSIKAKSASQIVKAGDVVSINPKSYNNLIKLLKNRFVVNNFLYVLNLIRLYENANNLILNKKINKNRNFNKLYAHKEYKLRSIMHLIDSLPSKGNISSKSVYFYRFKKLVLKKKNKSWKDFTSNKKLLGNSFWKFYTLSKIYLNILKLLPSSISSIKKLKIKDKKKFKYNFLFNLLSKSKKNLSLLNCFSKKRRQLIFYPPTYLEVSYKTMTGIVVKKPTKKNILLPVFLQ